MKNNIPTTAVSLFNAWLVGLLHTDTPRNTHIQVNGKQLNNQEANGVESRGRRLVNCKYVFVQY